MTVSDIQTAEREAKRFLERVKALREAYPKVWTYLAPVYRGSKESAAVRRASMDLTRALAEMRRHK